jgi:hypothetical protein
MDHYVKSIYPSPSHQPAVTSDTLPTTNIPAPKITKRVPVPNPYSKQVSQKPLIKNTKQAPASNPYANHVPPKPLAKIFTHPQSQPRSTGTPLRDNATDKMRGPPVTFASPSSSQSSFYSSNQSSSQSSPRTSPSTNTQTRCFTGCVDPPMDLIPVCPSCKVHITAKPTDLTQRASWKPGNCKYQYACTPPCNRRTHLSCIVQWHKPCPALRPTPRAADTRTMLQSSRSAAATTSTTAPQQMVTNTKKITAKHLIPTTAWDLLKRKNGAVSDMPTPSGTRQLETPYTLASAGGRTTSNNQPTFILGVGNEPPPSIPHRALHLQPHVPFPNPSDPSPRDYSLIPRHLPASFVTTMANVAAPGDSLLQQASAGQPNQPDQRRIPE